MFIIISFLLLSFTLFSFTACSLESDGNRYPEPEPYWFADNNTFCTNDINRAQEEIPFLIILPKYLPEDIPPYPVTIEGPLKGTYTANKSVTLKIRYGNNRVINIMEENNDAICWPSSEYNHVYYNINGIDVLEQKLIISVEDKVYESFHYTWNKNKISFMLMVYERSRSETRKVVESMIE